MRHLALLAAPLLTACVVHGVVDDTTFTSTNHPPHPMRARALDSVEIYTSSPPPRAYTEVGLLHSRAYSFEDAVAGLREKAASVGCDGVVVTSTGTAYNRIVYNGACFLYAEDTTWRAPGIGVDGAPSTVRADGGPDCAGLLAEVRAAPNDAKAAAAQRVPPECFASPRSTSPGS